MASNAYLTLLDRCTNQCIKCDSASQKWLVAFKFDLNKVKISSVKFV